MKKNLLMRFRSIRTSIIFSFTVLIVFALMIFLLLSLRFTREAVLENSTEYTSQLIGQVNNDIDSYIGYMENISLIVADNSDVWDYLFGNELSPEREQELPERILGVFRTITDTRSDIVNIALLPQRRGALINQGRARLNPYIDVSELSWSRIKTPSEVVSVGDTVDVFVKGLDRENGKISLGYKRPEDNPWVKLEQEFPVGTVCEAKIVGMTTFGAFASVIPGIDGLIHISQIADHRIDKPQDVLRVGEIVRVKLTDVDLERHRVSLSIRAVLEDEQDAADAAAQEEPEDAVVFSTEAERTEE